MHESVYLTTGEAADLVGVHESTVKRWCDVSDLECETTPGGHRRIRLESLLEYAERTGHKTPLHAFNGEAEAVYASALDSREARFDAAVRLVYRWMDARRPERLTHFFRFLAAGWSSLPITCDEIIRPAMEQVGHRWRTDQAGVGDEHRMTYVLTEALHAFRLTETRPDRRGRSVALVACLEDNRHEIGAFLVRIALEAHGWDVVYLGADVPISDIALQQQYFESTLVCISISPPQVSSDAIRAARILATTYDPAHPYRLVIGAPPSPASLGHQVPVLPFQDFIVLSSMSELSDWLNDQPAVHGSEVIV